MSGSLLYIDGIQKMDLSILSNLSKDLLKLRHGLVEMANSDPQPRRVWYGLASTLLEIILYQARRSSSPCRLYKEEKDDILNTDKNSIPESDRVQRANTESQISQSAYYGKQIN